MNHSGLASQPLATSPTALPSMRTFAVLKTEKFSRDSPGESPLLVQEAKRRSFFHRDRLEEAFNTYGELLYGGLLLFATPWLFVYFSLSCYILNDSTPLFLQTMVGGAVIVRVFVVAWISRQSFAERSSLLYALLLALVLPAIACMMTGIVLSENEEDRRVLLANQRQPEKTLATKQKDSVSKNRAANNGIAPSAAAIVTAQVETMAARQKRLQELEEAEMARIAS